jgi:DeoR/GlpR family transcriptional regulator of sugar metabolism
MNKVAGNNGNGLRNGPLYPSERQDALVQILRERRFASLHDLAESLHVSEVTVRRDLKRLKEYGLVRTVIGGAELAGSATEPPFRYKRVLKPQEKEAIARRALDLIHSGMTISLSAGTTTWTLAKLMKPGNLSGQVTFITNSVNVATALQNNGWPEIVLCGGNFRTPSDALVGPLAELTLRRLYSDILFLGIHGMDVERGLMTPNLLEQSTNRALIEQSGQVVVLADHSKWGAMATARVATWDEVGLLITDSAGGQAQVEALRKMGVRVDVAESGADGAPARPGPAPLEST